MKSAHNSIPARQRGVTLIVVLILLVVVTILGIGGARIALLGERSTRYDRDSQIAWQAAESALIDAEYDIAGPNAGGNQRVASFRPDNTGIFTPTCGTSLATRGLCEPSTSGTPIWKTVGLFDAVGSAAPTVAYGEMTSFPFVFGSGIAPAKLPRYIIEWVRDTRPGNDAAATAAGAARPAVLYRITSIGFGPAADVQVMMQSTFARK